jgi:RAD50-interacting protein 1
VDADATLVALDRYRTITQAPDFGDLDYESVDPKATKPTKGAIRVNDLLETITGRKDFIDL